MSTDHLSLLRAELATFQDCLAGDLTAPVGGCPGWTVRDLAEHLGQGNLWAAAAVTERHGRLGPAAAPSDVAAWFAATGRVLIDALDVDPTTEAWTIWPPRTAGFWRRRRWQETMLHRWDAQRAQGHPGVLDPAHCAEGVAEVGDTFLPRQVKLGRMPAPESAVRFTATDTGHSWLLGAGPELTTLSGTAEQILLALWNRTPWSTLAGDHELARKALPGPVVP